MTRRQLLAACAGTAALLAPAAAARPAPALRLVATDPVTVRGTHFHARESVRVTVRTADLTRIRRVRATATGSFTARFTAPVGYDPCADTLRVYATGARGDAAGLKLPQRACPPAP